MAYIFLDESGDLGFDFSKKKTSRYFMISFLFISSEQIKKKLDKIVKKMFAGFSKKEVKFHNGYLHAFREKPKIRIKVLSKIARHDLAIMTIRLNKKRVYAKLQDEEHLLYNYVTNILLDRVLRKKLLAGKEKITLVAAQRETNKFLNQNFKDYLEKKAKIDHGRQIEIIIKALHREKCLQIVDFISWSLFRYHEHGDNFYRNLIKEKIIEENNLFS